MCSFQKMKVINNSKRLERKYDRVARAEMYRRLKLKNETKLYRTIDLGPLKNLLMLTDAEDTRWFIVAHLFKAINVKSFRRSLKKAMSVESEMKFFREIELPEKSDVTVTHERHRAVKSNTMFVSLVGLLQLIDLYSQDEELKQSMANRNLSQWLESIDQQQ